MNFFLVFRKATVWLLLLNFLVFIGLAVFQGFDNQKYSIIIAHVAIAFTFVGLAYTLITQIDNKNTNTSNHDELVQGINKVYNFQVEQSNQHQKKLDEVLAELKEIKDENKRLHERLDHIEQEEKKKRPNIITLFSLFKR